MSTAIRSTEKIAGCVVLFNPEPATLQNISSYAGELDYLVIVDNSPVRSGYIADPFVNDPKVDYVFYGENLGIATALNDACKRAAEKGYAWMLTMDQDSRFTDDRFFDMFRRSAHDPAIAIFAASYSNVYGRWFRHYNEDFNEIHFAITSGNLVSLNQWKNVGGFAEKLFIDEVDHDFCLQLRLKKLKVVTTKQLLLNHMVGVPNKDAGSLAKPGSSRPSALRTYYITRNGLYMARKYFFKDFPFAFNRVFYLSKSLGRILFFYPSKKEYFSYFFLGVRDFLRSRFGKLER